MTPPGIGKVPQRIKFDRLSRFFVTANEAGQTESWHETGHFAQGVDFKLNRLFEKNGSNQFTGVVLGWDVQGTFEPSQNEIIDYQFYEQWLNGKRGVAMLMGNMLWLFRIRPLAANKFEDNRISLMTHPAYGKTYRNGAGEISGFIKNFEMITVKDFAVTTNGQMQFTKVHFLAPGDKTTAGAPTGPTGGKQ